MGLEVHIGEIGKHFRGFEHDLVENNRSSRTRTEYVMFVLIVSTPCIPSVLNTLVEQVLVGVDSGLSLLRGEDVLRWSFDNGRYAHACGR